MQTEIDWEGVIRPFFHRGMLHTWRPDVLQSEEDIPGLPGWKRVPYEEGQLLLIDAFCEKLSGGLGFIQISQTGVPIWVTHWDGAWTNLDRALVVLRKAMYAAHSIGKFYGGRGVPETVEGDSRYFLSLEQNGFHSFGGLEAVLTDEEEILTINFKGGVFV